MRGSLERCGLGPRRLFFWGARFLAGKITALKVQSRNRRRVSVYLDGAFAFGLPDIVAATLHVGQSLSDDEIADLRRRGSLEQAYDCALGYLSYRPRSVSEVRHHLAGKEVPEELIVETVERLVRAGLLDDDAFARFWVENRSSFRPRGQLALRYELRGKGVSEEAINSAVEAVDECEEAYRAAQPRALRLARVDRDTFRRRLADFLRRRGFSYETVRETVERLWQESRSSEDAESELPSDWGRR